MPNALAPLHAADGPNLGVGDLRPLHYSDHPAVLKALSGDAEYSRIRRMLADLRAYSVHVPLEQQAAQLVMQVLRDALESGDPLPADLVAAIPDCSWAARVAEATHTAVQVIREELRGRLSGALPSAAIRRSVDEALVACVVRASDLLESGAPRTVDDALETNRVEDFRATEAVETEYAELRKIQLLATDGVTLTGRQQGLILSWYVADPLKAISLDLAKALNDGEPATGGLMAEAQELPTDWTQGSAVWWFASTGATPWAPTFEEQKEARTQLIAAVTAPPTAAARKAETSRRDAVDRGLAVHQEIAYAQRRTGR